MFDYVCISTFKIKDLKNENEINFTNSKVSTKKLYQFSNIQISNYTSVVILAFRNRIKDESCTLGNIGSTDHTTKMAISN